MTLTEFQTLRHFRGTGKFVAKSGGMQTKLAKDKMKLETLFRLRALCLLEHFCANEWYLTDAGRVFLRNPEFYKIEL